MTRRLPNLNQLRAFEAAARHLSFKNAADELNVTHAAVSHQIKALEADLGLQLFHRRTRKVELTSMARAYAERLGAIFAGLAEATRAFDADLLTGTIRLSVPPYFSDRLLMPRLSRFHAAHPGLTVVAVANAAKVDLKTSDFDAAIRYGTGNWPGLEAIRLHRAVLVPVAAPTLLGGRTCPLAPEEIAALPRGCLKGQEQDWADWFAVAAHNAQVAPPVAHEAGTRIVDVAFSGQYAALVSTLVVAEDVASGELAQLSQYSLETPRAMHVVYQSTDFPDPRIRTFAAWLTDELAAGISSQAAAPATSAP